MAGVMLKQRLSHAAWRPCPRWPPWPRWPRWHKGKARSRFMAHCVSVFGLGLGLAAWGLCSAGLVACKKKTAPLPAPQPELREDSSESSENAEPPSLSAPGTASPSQGPVPARCRELPQAAPFRIGELASRHASASDPDDGGPDDDDEVPDPYAVELGAVHGDPDPPLFAAHGKDLWLVVPDTDAGGGMLRVGLVRDARASAQVNFGPEITGVRRDSTFALEASGDRALLAYAAETAGKIRVFGVLLEPNDLKQKLSPEPLSAAGADVDSPRLALRNGGYWLAVARSLDAPKTKAKPMAADAGPAVLE